MDVSVQKADNAAPRIDSVMVEIRRRISARSLSSGAKLPSVRGFAKAMQVSTSTVVEAYERLVAEGAIRSRPGSGFYVASTLAPLSLVDIGPKLDRAVDPFWVSRMALDGREGMIKPGCGWLPSSWMPEDTLRRAMRNVSRAGTEFLTDYSSPLGLLPLRQLLSRRLGDVGVHAGAEQILLADSGTQAIDLLCRFLLEPGQTVLVDDPCYFNFHAILRAHRVKVIGVPYTPSGPDIALFEQALEEHRPRLYITNSAIHNPTGAVLSPVTAHRVLMLVERAGMTIIEDDIFADFEEQRAPRLAAFDGLNRVVQIGSFSKTLSASVRCGYIAAPKDWIEPLTDMKIAASFSGSQLCEALVLSALKDGSYRRHIEAMKVRLARARLDTITKLKPLGITPWIEPQAGVFLWCRLPDGVDAADVARHALTENVVLAPGNVFSQAQTAAGYMRFNVSQCDDPKLVDILRTAINAALRQ
ncbi:PLP-dependent aminotransferase family protein [Agrobacterium sp. rho-13.3]|uniref:aminotransferase-like domain-containing protein n=1 Tax=Agrobacterium sp. rho-13.3 TaxID=3072980 RepID=UPI002A1204DC|nr:PLP-dependent aminotransferase family protein [Agrobacterium sp. rho-13.3]MDX8309711.1 PLP-dependent aminotransferase family protein [Agrobacterium sp. rho-13.3]